MILRATEENGNSEVVLPTIGYAIKAGIAVTITDEQFYHNDIQIALRKNILEIVDTQGHENSAFAKNVQIKNLSGKPLALDNISLLKGETKFISEKETQTTNVQTAINAGLIKICKDNKSKDVQVEKAKQVTKDVVRVQKKTKKIDKKQENKIKKLLKDAAKIDVHDDSNEEDEEFYEVGKGDPKARLRIKEELSKETRTTMQSWDPYEKKMLPKEESSRKVAKIMNSRVQGKKKNEDGIMIGEIDFTQEDETPVKVNRNGKKAKQGLQPVGRVRKESKPGYDEEILLNEAEVSFVDREQKIQRIKSRPDMLAKQNSEIDLD